MEQLDIFGNFKSLEQIKKEQKLDARYQRKSLTEYKKYLIKTKVIKKKSTR